jgi:hypothetical protein
MALKGRQIPDILVVPKIGPRAHYAMDGRGHGGTSEAGAATV